MRRGRDAESARARRQPGGSVPPPRDLL